MTTARPSAATRVSRAAARARGPRRGSERVLDRRVEEVAVLVPAGLADELAREEVAIAHVALEVARDVVGREDVGLRSDVAGGGRSPRPQHGATLVVQPVTI